MKIGGYEFPEQCPEGCSARGEPQYQGNFCARCPIFNCAGDDPALHPDDFRADLAQGYYEYFKERGLL
jgi:hypothetical protein